MKRFIIVALALVVVACNEEAPLAPVGEDADLHYGEWYGRWKDDVRVMTRNVYVGADVDVILEAQDPTEVPVLVAEAFQTLIATNFPERAKALAREISRTAPDLVGLQEISTIRTQSPGDAVIGGTAPAETVLYDYLEILMAALEARGERYRVVALVQNPDVELPMFTGFDASGAPTFDDVRLTDYDVILARKGVRTSDVVEKNYAAKLVIPGANIEIPRGYVAVTARVGHRSYRFVNTHLEPASDLLQGAQAAELVADLASETLPVILLGDLNTPAPDGTTYQYLLSEGFQDAWTARPRRDEGFTCCHDPGLMNTSVNLEARIDLILGRPAESQEFRAPLARVVGDELRDRTASGLWPSDHAGVSAGLQFSRGHRR